jgi:hypothetical protein
MTYRHAAGGCRIPGLVTGSAGRNNSADTAGPNLVEQMYGNDWSVSYLKKWVTGLSSACPSSSMSTLSL